MTTGHTQVQRLLRRYKDVTLQAQGLLQAVQELQDETQTLADELIDGVSTVTLSEALRCDGDAADAALNARRLLDEAAYCVNLADVWQQAQQEA